MNTFMGLSRTSKGLSTVHISLSHDDVDFIKLHIMSNRCLDRYGKFISVGYFVQGLVRDFIDFERGRLEQLSKEGIKNDK